MFEKNFSKFAKEAYAVTSQRESGGVGFNITYWRLLTHSSDILESGKFKTRSGQLQQ